MAKIQADELRVHADELSKVWEKLDEERQLRIEMEQQLLAKSDRNSPETLPKVSNTWNSLPYTPGTTYFFPKVGVLGLGYFYAFLGTLRHRGHL